MRHCGLSLVSEFDRLNLHREGGDFHLFKLVVFAVELHQQLVEHLIAADSQVQSHQGQARDVVQAGGRQVGESIERVKCK